ncbi:MAG: segregation/condensation protein A [Candidatus Paceibacterota bacterium]|jgi:segregation and condensation protein A
MESIETIEYKVKTSVFEGPLELLLDLIERRKLFVNDVSLAQVTEDYINHIKTMNDGANMSDITSFIVVAATLILIKSKSLLPNINLTEDEESQITNLEDRLRLYQIIRDATVGIKERFGKQIIFEGGALVNNQPIWSPDSAITTPRMHQAINDVLNSIPKKEFLPKVNMKKVVSIEEMIDSLTARIQAGIKMSFKEFSRSKDAETIKEQKVYVIVGFLAMLELIREGILEAVQNDNFSDIEIEKRVIDETLPEAE